MLRRALFVKDAILRNLPRSIRVTLENARILAREYGQGQTAKTGQSIGRAGEPIPWYTYPAIEYLSRIDWSTSRIFEFGSGNSTRWWAARAAAVVSVENDPAWYTKLAPQLPATVTYLLRPNHKEYMASVAENGPYDVIIVDGFPSRLACAQAALPYLAPNGLVILDNADWCLQTRALLREKGLLEVSFNGFGPINPYTWMTSIFLMPGWQQQLKFIPPIGGIPGNGD